MKLSFLWNRLYFNILCTFINIFLVLCLNIQLNCKCTCIGLLWCIKDRGCSCVGWHNNPWIWKISTWRQGLRAGDGLHEAAMHKTLCGKLEGTKMRVLSPKKGQDERYSVFIMLTWVYVYAWIYSLPLLFFFSLYSQWRVPSVSDDNITWLPTKVEMPKK